VPRDRNVTDDARVAGQLVGGAGVRRLMVCALVMVLAMAAGCSRHEPGNPFIGPEGSGTQAPLGKQQAAPAPVVVANQESSPGVRALP
jgi:hypothetical protein